MARAKREDKTAFMRYDILIINGEEYKPPYIKKKIKNKAAEDKSKRDW